MRRCAHWNSCSQTQISCRSAGSGFRLAAMDERKEETSVYKPVASWNTDDVVAWIRGLGESLSPHIPQFLAHCICGSDLLKMNKQQLEYLKVTQMGHQELLLEAVENLSALDLSCSQNPTMSLVSTLSKKTSQLITVLDHAPHTTKKLSQSHQESGPELPRVNIAADIMMSARSLINWLDRNPTNLVLDYNQFRQEILKDALKLSSILSGEEEEEKEGGEGQKEGEPFDKQQVLEACRRILKQTQVMMSPQNFALIEPIRLHTVPLSPTPKTGLGISFQRTKQGNLLVNGILPESPAALCGKIRLGDELVQINHQNVVGWEITSVVTLLKASGHEIVMVFKAGLNHSQEEEEEEEQGGAEGVDRSCDAREQSTNGIVGEEESCDSLEGIAEDRALERLQRPSLSPGSDSDVSSPGSTPPTQLDKHKNLKRTASNPLLDGERSKVGIGGSKRFSDSSELEETDGKKDVSFGAQLQIQRTSSEGSPLRPDNEPQKQVPQVAYRTQIVAGVVMRIPIKPEEQASPKQKKGSGGRKPPKGRKHNPPAPPSPVDGDIDKGKVVFTDPKDIVVDGQATKQITVTSTGEPQFNSKEAGAAHKKSNPALMMPCFQLKDVDHEGWMHKLGGTGFTPRNWRRRWFVLKDGKLYYYKTSFDVTATGMVDLVGYTVEAAADIKKKHCFKVVQDGMRTYYFQADTSEQMLMWMQKLAQACKVATETATHVPQSFDEAHSEDELSN